MIFAKSSVLDIWLSPEYTSVSIEKKLFCRIEKDGERIILQYLMILQHQNIKHTSMVTVKCKKILTNDDALRNSPI